MKKLLALLIALSLCDTADAGLFGKLRERRQARCACSCSTCGSCAVVKQSLTTQAVQKAVPRYRCSNGVCVPIK